ncbi:hypothetical protein [Mycolicibacterium sp. S2-37]|uniref:hypothetical protein n=1 Tax=Mycolicibacterium sp. S2-37 TaxID=2810297 RepID=UPI0027DA43AE|nr:hypothetical protein [Mycolicibacterium sp. S2-37]
MACIPGLLMLATFGLERLETVLTRDCASTSDVDEFLQHAAQRDIRRPVRDSGPMPRAQRVEPAGTLPTKMAEAGLPTRVYTTHVPNPQFQPTRHANRV